MEANRKAIYCVSCPQGIVLVGITFPDTKIGETNVERVWSAVMRT